MASCLSQKNSGHVAYRLVVDQLQVSGIVAGGKIGYFSKAQDRYRILINAVLGRR